MTTPGNTAKHTHTRDFALGKFNLTVVASRLDESPIDELGLDHVMECLMDSTQVEVVSLPSRASGVKLEAGTVTHSSSRKMEIDGTTLYVEVGITFDRKVCESTLAGIANQILNDVTGCMIHVLDPSCPVMAVTVFYL